MTWTHLADTATAVLLALQSSEESYMLDCYTNNPLGMHWCALADITAAFGGQGVFGLTVGALVFVVGYFVTGGDIVTPSVVLLLLGGILVPSLPAQYHTLALTIMFAGAVGAVMQLLNRYVFTTGI